MKYLSSMVFKGGIYFIQLEPENQCDISRVGRIQGNTVFNNYADQQGA